MTIYKDQLEAVSKLLENPKRWTKGFFARNADLDPIEENYDVNDDGEDLGGTEVAQHPEATCWCLYGAAFKCGISAHVEYAQLLGGDAIMDVAEFNDAQTTTHDDVLSVLRSAIDRAPVRP